MKSPLVSILIANYNYARYLRQCLDSVLMQTYPEIEVIISDNQSTDDSYIIMETYKRKFQERGIWCDVLQNKRNIGSSGNTEKCFYRSEGKYHMWLSSDDYLEPRAIETMVNALKGYPSAGFVMAHRNAVDENGNVSSEPAFYNKSCFIPGESQACVFMMAGIAVSSQILWDKAAYTRMVQNKPLRFQVAGDWFDNFLMSCVGDVLYIDQPLINYRTHANNETSVSEDNLIGIFEHYQLIHAFSWIADSYGYTRPQKRVDEAVKKLGGMCLRYARKMLLNEKYEIAEKYLLLGRVFDKELINNDNYQWLNSLLDGITEKDMEKLQASANSFARTVSYDPPEDCIELKL